MCYIHVFVGWLVIICCFGILGLMEKKCNFRAFVIVVMAMLLRDSRSYGMFMIVCSLL
jgi:hypothetical protein